MNPEIQKENKLSKFMVELLELGHSYPNGWIMIPVRTSTVTVQALVRRGMIEKHESRILPGFSLTEKGRSLVKKLFAG